MASVNLGSAGQTIHTLAGVKVPIRASDFSTMNSVMNRRKWMDLECLILDECGMLAADFLDWLDVNVRTIRHRPLEPFGGIQLIFVGDFAQLGPVPGGMSLHQAHHHHRGSGLGGPPYAPTSPEADCFLNIKECTAFAFQSALWRAADFVHVHLTTVYRQSDQAFVGALQDLREQRPYSPRVQTLVSQCSIPLSDIEARRQVFGEDDTTVEIPSGILPTLLYTNNRNADRENAERLGDLISTHHKRFVAIDTVHLDKEVPSHAVTYVRRNLSENKFFEQCQASKHLDLRVGAQVMLVQNLFPDDDLVNGSRGVVEKFALVPMVRDFRQTEERLLNPEDQSCFPPGYTFEQLKFGMTVQLADKTIWSKSGGQLFISC
jgi:ATP-dependent DNA helicase PIF1